MAPRTQQSGPGAGRQTYPCLLFESASATRPPGDQESSFARDLNFDQIVAAIAGKREQRELITNVLFGNLRDADTVALERELGARLGLRVTLEPKKRGGALILHYATLDQLDRVLTLLRAG